MEVVLSQPGQDPTGRTIHLPVRRMGLVSVYFEYHTQLRTHCRTDRRIPVVVEGARPVVWGPEGATQEALFVSRCNTHAVHWICVNNLHCRGRRPQSLWSMPFEESRYETRMCWTTSTPKAVVFLRVRMEGH